jgi:hypothetical protein
MKKLSLYLASLMLIAAAVVGCTSNLAAPASVTATYTYATNADGSITVTMAPYTIPAATPTPPTTQPTPTGKAMTAFTAAVDSLLVTGKTLGPPYWDAACWANTLPLSSGIGAKFPSGADANGVIIGPTAALDATHATLGMGETFGVYDPGTKSVVQRTITKVVNLTANAGTILPDITVVMWDTPLPATVPTAKILQADAALYLAPTTTTPLPAVMLDNGNHAIVVNITNLANSSRGGILVDALIPTTAPRKNFTLTPTVFESGSPVWLWDGADFIVVGCVTYGSTSAYQCPSISAYADKIDAVLVANGRAKLIRTDLASRYVKN